MSRVWLYVADTAGEDLHTVVLQRAHERAYQRLYGRPWSDGSETGQDEASEAVAAQDVLQAMDDVLRPWMREE